jgi:hypothetical protein
MREMSALPVCWSGEVVNGVGLSEVGGSGAGGDDAGELA